MVLCKLCYPRDRAIWFYRTQDGGFVIALCSTCSMTEDPNIRKNKMVHITREEYDVAVVLLC